MSDADHLRAAAKDCVHCGFCLPACPTYQLWGEEMDSPRGRIHLVSQVLDGAPLTAAAASHFDRCLGCMACMTACPSGVQYDVLIEAAREWVEDPSSVPAPPSGEPRDEHRRDGDSGTGGGSKGGAPYGEGPPRGAASASERAQARSRRAWGA